MSDSDRASWARFLPPFVAGKGIRQFASRFSGRTALVTGAAGFIGSALARVLSDADLKELLLLDCAEGGLLELAKKLRNVSIEVYPYNVEDSEALEWLFSHRRVDVIFHTAAWKHVPLLEGRPFSAMHNNALGTYHLARAACHAGVPKFVLVSTDKAVNPRSIMGASKRIAELGIVSMSNSTCRMNAIRLCNVIGSSGSVVPIFLEQIEKQQPVTVTDSQARRWFLTLGEAVSAILAGGLTEQHGKILLPRVGDPVCIGDLARFLIHSMGNDWCGEVKHVGLRPGEKLTEELMLPGEREVRLEGDLAVLETPAPGGAELDAVMNELGARIAKQDLAGLLRVVQSLVPEYQPSGQLLEQAAAMAVR